LVQAAGARWYAEERARCVSFGERYGIAPENVAGAAAAISPGMKWDAVFAHLAALRLNPLHAVPTYNREFVRRAVRCLNGEDPALVLGGPKVIAFYKLLAGRDMAAVVIDGHAWNICRHDPVTFRRRPGYWPPAAARVTAYRYRVASAAYRQVGELLGEPAHSVQAATWLHWRELIAE
jgi:hypothetical protein